MNTDFKMLMYLLFNFRKKLRCWICNYWFDGAEVGVGIVFGSLIFTIRKFLNSFLYSRIYIFSSVVIAESSEEVSNNKLWISVLVFLLLGSTFFILFKIHNFTMPGADFFGPDSLGPEIDKLITESLPQGLMMVIQKAQLLEYHLAAVEALPQLRLIFNMLPRFTDNTDLQDPVLAAITPQMVANILGRFLDDNVANFPLHVISYCYELLEKEQLLELITYLIKMM